MVEKPKTSDYELFIVIKLWHARIAVGQLRTLSTSIVRSVAWENIELGAQNQLHVWLHRNVRERYQAWNDIVDRHKTEVIAPLINEKVIPFQLERGLDVALVHSTSWDVLGALMENSYLDTHHPAHFFLELLWVYEAGHFPCGWLGSWPKGRLIVF